MKEKKGWSLKKSNLSFRTIVRHLLAETLDSKSLGAKIIELVAKEPFRYQHGGNIGKVENIISLKINFSSLVWASSDGCSPSTRISTELQVVEFSFKEDGLIIDLDKKIVYFMPKGPVGEFTDINKCLKAWAA